MTQRLAALFAFGVPAGAVLLVIALAKWRNWQDRRHRYVPHTREQYNPEDA